MSRIGRRVLGSYVVLMVIVVLAVSVTSGFVLRRELLTYLEDDMARQARQMAVTLARAAEGDTALGSDPAALQALVADSGAASDVRFTVIAADGVVLADSAEDPGTMENHATRPEVIVASAGGEGRSRRFSATLGKETVYVAVPLAGGSTDRTAGVVRVSVPADRIDSLLTRVWWVPLLVGLLALIPAVGVAYLLSRSLTRPVERMRAMAVNVARGELSFRLATPQREDELGELARALNQMAAELERRVTQLEDERVRMADILASMNDGVVVVDADGVIKGANAAAARLIGAATELIEGEPLVKVARMFPARSLMVEALEDGVGFVRQVELPGDRSLEVHVIPLPFSGSEIQQVLMVLHDRTEQVRVDRLRKDFVANVSHELKTPLAGLSLLGDTVCRTVDDDPEAAREFSGRLQTEIQRLTGLVDDLLALAELDESPPVDDLEAECVDLSKITREVAASFQERFREKDISLEADSSEQAVIRGDYVALATLVRNLLDNALRYTEPGGHVTISTTVAEGHATLQVTDDGIGVPRDDRERIFERFYRVDKARSRQTGGTGLGLSIVRNVVHLHGGTVKVTSEVGVGSTFTVTLPTETKSC